MKVMNDVIESLFVELAVQIGRNIVLGVIYRPPKSSHNEFLTALDDILQNQSLRNKDCIRTGDFNINMLSNRYTPASDFLDNLLSASFLPLISKPTRVTNHSATLLDIICTNIQPLPKAGVVNVVTDISDHFLVFTNLDAGSNKVTSTNKYKLRRKFTPENIALLQKKLDSVDWSDVYNANENIDRSFNIFSDI